MSDDKNKFAHHMTRTASAQGAGIVVSNGFAALMTAVGFPEAAVLKPLVQGTTISLMNLCYDDMTKRRLSERENEKVDLLAETSLRTFMKLAEEDGVTAITMQIDEGQLKNAYEVSEELMLAAIRQSQDKKVEILGRYYGKTFYEGKIDWQDMHQIIMMAGTLTYRQVVLIRLIFEGFKDISPEMFVTNPSACVEINRMRDYGLWMTDMAMFKNDASATIQLRLLKPTEYTQMVYDALMLEKLSDEDIKRTIDSLALSDQGEPAEGITKEDYENNTGMYYDETNQGLVLGRKSGKEIATSPDDMSHVLRGKDLMNEATDNGHSGEYMQSIDYIMRALTEFKQCKAEVLYQSSVNDALEALISYFEYCEGKGGIRILRSKRKNYEAVLSDLRSEHLAKCLEYLGKADEKDEGFDKELGEKEMASWFKNTVDEKEKKFVV
jgi:hypothetical protein